MTTQADIEDDERAYKHAQWDIFFDRLEEWIEAKVIDMKSIHVEDSIRVRELRRELIINLLNKDFDLNV